jgi:adenosine kinase
MPILICGSLAFDTITNFEGRFAQQILPNQVHILNVSFLVPTLRREYGGCAGNIAYTLAQLGAEPLIMATLGSDGADYLERIRSWGASTEYVRVIEDSYTAQAIIITDTDNNQITAFPSSSIRVRVCRCSTATSSGISSPRPPGLPSTTTRHECSASARDTAWSPCLAHI